MRTDRPKVPFSVAVVLVGAALVVAAGPAAAARKNNPNIELEFLPQQAVGAAEAMVRGAMLEKPVRVRLEDSRPGEDESLIGIRTNDDDRRFELKAVGDNAVVEFVDEVLRDAMVSWGVQVSDDAPRELAVRLLKFDVLEKNQVIGATYNAEVRFAFSLGGASGTVMGDATRYGRKFSQDNINEVLSDALLEVVAEMLSDYELQQAWDG